MNVVWGFHFVMFSVSCKHRMVVMKMLTLHNVMYKCILTSRVENRIYSFRYHHISTSDNRTLMHFSVAKKSSGNIETGKGFVRKKSLLYRMFV